MWFTPSGIETESLPYFLLTIPIRKIHNLYVCNQMGRAYLWNNPSDNPNPNVLALGLVFF